MTIYTHLWRTQQGPMLDPTAPLIAHGIDDVVRIIVRDDEDRLAGIESVLVALAETLTPTQKEDLAAMLGFVPVKPRR